MYEHKKVVRIRKDMLWQIEDRGPNLQQIKAENAETGRIIIVTGRKAGGSKRMIRIAEKSVRQGERADLLLGSRGKRKVHLQLLRWRSVFAVYF